MKDDENVKQEMEWYKNKVELLSMKYFPQTFQDSMRNIRKILYGTLDNTVKVLRWRCNREGSPKPFINMSMYFSKQPKNWKLVPRAFGISFSSRNIPPYPSRIAVNVKALVNKNCLEPLGHELLREAEKIDHQSSRSSVIVLLSALEVGLKEFISRLNPDSEWLVANIPSPPVCKMLEEYLPKLPVKNKINGQSKPPPKEIMDVIEVAVQIRNRVAHVGAKGPDDERIKQIFSAVKDILWLLDYYSGHNWAYEYISAKTRLSLESSS